MEKYTFPIFEKYDNWYWHQTGNHATIEQYHEAKARVEKYTSKADKK